MFVVEIWKQSECQIRTHENTTLLPITAISMVPIASSMWRIASRIWTKEELADELFLQLHSATDQMVGKYFLGWQALHKRRWNSTSCRVPPRGEFHVRPLPS